MVNLKSAGMAALGVTGISYLLGLGYNKLLANGLATITLSAVDVPVRQQITSGIDTSLAGKVLGYFGGIIPVGEMWLALITMFLASFIIVYGGAWIGERVELGKTDTMRFGVGMAITAGIVGLLVGNLSVSVGAIGAGLAMLIYYVIIAAIYGFARRFNGVKDFLPIP